MPPGWPRVRRPRNCKKLGGWRDPMWPHNLGGDWRQQMTGGGQGGGPTPRRCSECLRCRQASVPTGQDFQVKDFQAPDLI